MNHPMNENGLYDIYSVWHVPFWQTSWFYTLMIAAGIALCALVILMVYKTFFAKKVAPLAPWQKALNDLYDLEQLDLSTQENGKQFYLKLTAILKQYLQDRFQLPLVAKTDAEMASYLQDSDLEKKYKISEICNGCVLIKFANQSAIEEQSKAHLNLALKLVSETIPKKMD